MMSFFPNALTDIAPPSLMSIGGCQVIPANDPAKGDYVEMEMFIESLIPITVCRFQQRWKVLGIPTSIGAPSNPIFQDDGNDGFGPTKAPPDDGLGGFISQG
jgi:hypothetical protein